jgi:hypothetical protein
MGWAGRKRCEKKDSAASYSAAAMLSRGSRPNPMPQLKHSPPVASLAAAVGTIGAGAPAFKGSGQGWLDLQAARVACVSANLAGLTVAHRVPRGLPPGAASHSPPPAPMPPRSSTQIAQLEAKVSAVMFCQPFSFLKPRLSEARSPACSASRSSTLVTHHSAMSRVVTSAHARDARSLLTTLSKNAETGSPWRYGTLTEPPGPQYTGIVRSMVIAASAIVRAREAARVPHAVHSAATTRGRLQGAAQPRFARATGGKCSVRNLSLCRARGGSVVVCCQVCGRAVILIKVQRLQIPDGLPLLHAPSSHSD